MKNTSFPDGKHNVLQNWHFQEQLEKALQKLSKIHPKSAKTPSKTGEKSTNLVQKQRC